MEKLLFLLIASLGLAACSSIDELHVLLNLTDEDIGPYVRRSTERIICERDRLVNRIQGLPVGSECVQNRNVMYRPSEVYGIDVDGSEGSITSRIRRNWRAVESQTICGFRNILNSYDESLENIAMSNMSLDDKIEAIDREVNRFVPVSEAFYREFFLYWRTLVDNVAELKGTNVSHHEYFTRPYWLNQAEGMKQVIARARQ